VDGRDEPGHDDRKTARFVNLMLNGATCSVDSLSPFTVRLRGEAWGEGQPGCRLSDVRGTLPRIAPAQSGLRNPVPLHRNALPDEPFLLRGLYRVRPYRPHACDRFRRLHADLDQKPRRYRTGTSESSAAMDQHVTPTAQERANLFAGDLPLVFKSLVRN
jgi:hypothetical protein